MLGSYIIRNFIGTSVSCSYPYYKHFLSINIFNGSSWLIVGQNKIVEANHRLLNIIQFIYVDSTDRSFSSAVFFFYTYYDITATGVFEVIGKGTNSSIDGVRIPSLLKLYSITLNDSAVYQRLNIYW